MTLDEFEALADAYGADVTRWPADRQRAASLIAAQAPGSAVLAAAADLDDLLASSRPHVASAALRDRILASAPAPKAARAGLGLGLGWRLKAGLGAGFASAGVAGIVAGFALNTAAMEPSELALTTLATPAVATSFGPAPEAQED